MRDNVNGDRIEILLVEDNHGDARLVREAIAEAGNSQFELTRVERLSEALQHLSTNGCDVILLDLSLPDSHGFDTFAKVHAQTPQVPIMVLSGLDDETLAVKAVRQGAQDYLVKGQAEGNLLVRAIRYAIERKQADEALRQRTEELEKAYEELKAMHDFMIESARLRALGEMASGVAHDFNNILSIIIGRAQLALEDTKDPGVVNALQIIEETGLDGAQTVRRLQDFARVRIDQDFDSVNLNAIVESALQMVEPRRAEGQEMGVAAIDICTELEKLAPVNGNPSELKEALVNILFNAMDAMPDGGKITVKTMVENDQVVVSISDTGVGMTDEIKSKIFDPFFTTKGHHGFGMGLSVTYGIVTRHRGTIDVDSAPGKGTSFHIKLPAATRPKKKARNGSITPSGDIANILLVDDDPQVSEVLKLILNQMGHYVTEVNNGKEAISTFEKGDYTLVITDLGMPDMSGREVARAVKERKPKTPVILTTGWGVQLNPEEMRKVGIDGVVPKPLSREALSVQIAGLLPSSSRG